MPEAPLAAQTSHSSCRGSRTARPTCRSSCASPRSPSPTRLRAPRPTRRAAGAAAGAAAEGLEPTRGSCPRGTPRSSARPRPTRRDFPRSAPRYGRRGEMPCGVGPGRSRRARAIGAYGCHIERRGAMGCPRLTRPGAAGRFLPLQEATYCARNASDAPSGEPFGGIAPIRTAGSTPHG